MIGIGMALAACATTDEIANKPPFGTWQYARDYNAVSECLVRTLNFEFQPKTGVEQLFGRSIAHHIHIQEPGKINRVTHEHIGPSAQWLFRVTNQGQSRASVEGFVFIGYESTIEVLTRAAGNCGPTR